MNKTVSEYRKEIELAKADTELKASLDALINNKDFQNLILKEYLCDEVIRNVSLKCDPVFSSADGQASLDRRINGASALAEFFRAVDSKAKSADNIIINALAEIQIIEEGGYTDDE